MRILGWAVASPAIYFAQTQSHNGQELPLLGSHVSHSIAPEKKPLDLTDQGQMS